jgi:hypothetical protein
MDGKQDRRKRPDRCPIRRSPGAFFILNLFGDRKQFRTVRKSEISDCGIACIVGCKDFRLEDIPRCSEDAESGGDGDGPGDPFFAKEEDEDNDGEVTEGGKQILRYTPPGPPCTKGFDRIAVDINGKPTGNQKSQRLDGNERGIDEEQPQTESDGAPDPG